MTDGRETDVIFDPSGSVEHLKELNSIDWDMFGVAGVNVLANIWILYGSAGQ